MRGSFVQDLGSTLVLFAVSAPAISGGPLVDGDFDPSFQGDGTYVFYDDSLGGQAAGVDLSGRLLIGYTEVLAGTDRDMRLVRVPDEGVAANCGRYFPDLGGTDEDILADIEVDGTVVFLAGTAAGPPEDPLPQVAIGAFDLATCQKLPFGGEDGALYASSVDYRGVAIEKALGGAIRVAAQSGSAGSRQLRTYGLDSAGAIDGGFSPELTDFTPAFDADYFEPRDMVRQPDGKLVVVGTLRLTNGDRDVGVARFTAGGALDSSFSIDGLLAFSYDIIDGGSDEGNAVAILHDGRIVVGGSSPGFLVETKAALAVLTPTGGYFNDFGIVGRYSFRFGSSGSDTIEALATQGDGKIVAVGATISSGGFSDWGGARLFATGDAPLDPSFSGDGKWVHDFELGGQAFDHAYGVTLEQGGKISVVGGASDGSTGFHVAAARFWNSYIFADGFESGSRYYWEAAQP